MDCKATKSPLWYMALPMHVVTPIPDCGKLYWRGNSGLLILSDDEVVDEPTNNRDIAHAGGFTLTSTPNYMSIEIIITIAADAEESMPTVRGCPVRTKSVV
eukprot:scaffold545205_cov14-Prasinocladus_malaysianus.AAC.1